MIYRLLTVCSHLARQVFDPISNIVDHASFLFRFLFDLSNFAVQ